LTDTCEKNGLDDPTRLASPQSEARGSTPPSLGSVDFRTLFDASPTPLLVIAPPDWTIVAANDARLQVTGEKREQVIGRRLFEVYPDDPADPDASGVRNLTASLGRVMATKAADVMAVQRYSVQTSDGRFVERWWSPVNSPVLGENGEVTLIIHRVEEVTEIVRMRGEAKAADQLARDQQAVIDRLRATEAALRLNQGRLGAALAVSRLGTFEWNLRTGAVELDDRAREIFGFQPHQGVVEQEVFDRIHPADLMRVQGQARQSHEAIGRLETEYRLRLPNGAIRIVRSISDFVAGAEGRADRMVGVFDDITARHADQQLLRESEERSRRIVEGVKDYAVFITDAAGLIVDWTPGAEAIFGWTREKIVGESCELLFTPEDRAAGTPAYELRTAREKGCANDERWHLRRDGSRFFANGSVRPLHGAGGVVAGYIKIARDETSRRAVDDRLRASEELNRRILASSADCIKVLNLDGCVEFMSEGGMCVMEVDDFGDIEGRCWPEFWQGQEHARALQAVATAKAGGTGRFQGFAPTMKGTPRWWDVIVTPIAGATGEPEKLLSVSRDVTATRDAEEKLRGSEARYRTLFEAIDAGFCIIELKFDEQHQPIDYRLAEINPAFERQTGLQGAAGRWVSEVAPGLERHWFETYGRVALTGEPVRFENRAEPFGRWYDVHAFRTGDPLERRVAILFNDITERRTAEERLRNLNETLEAQVAERTADRDRLWRNSQDLLLIARFDATIMAVNPAWKKVLGWEEHELIGSSFMTFVHPDDLEATAQEASSLSGEGRSVMQFVNRYRAKDDGWRWLSWAVTSHDDFFHGVARDVTAEKERQDELESAQEALRQAQKMEAMGQLTGGVAHDFNNLLTPIVGSLDMLQRKGLGGEREQRLIAGAAQSAERAKTLVQRLLAFARRQPLQPVPVDIAKLVIGMGDLVSSTTGPQIKVVVDAPEDLPAAKADPNQLEMALLNLAVNARDAMPEGGTLRISADAESVKAGHRSKLRPGHYVRLSVADTGHGMDEATLARAVEPFFSTKGVGKGTGLGLSMVHGLASQLGGVLTIQSRPGLGTNVELWVPQTTAAPHESAVAIDYAPDGQGKGIALLVDDEELVRMSTADMLNDLGYKVVEAATAEAALDLIEHGQRFDLVVTDHLMPGMTGTDLARALRSSRPDLPVLLVSGYAEREGADPDLPRLVKPFRKDELATILAQLPPST
jgi:PAS domain S-box-containing protein